MRIYVLLMAACLCACKPKPAAPAGTVAESIAATAPLPPPPTRSIGPVDVAVTMGATNITATSYAIPDGRYVMPTLGWIEREFSHGLFGFQHALGIATWTAEAWDCDKFAIGASFYGKFLNSVSPNRNVAAALAIGELYYVKDVGGGHAINFFIVQAGQNLQIIFYEPQTRAVVSLSPTERERVMFWKL